MRGKSPSLTSETKGHAPTVGRGKIFFSKIFFQGASCPKNSGGFTGRQNFTIPISSSQGHEWPSTGIVGTRSPDNEGRYSSPKFESNFGRNSNSAQILGGDGRNFLGMQLKLPTVPYQSPHPDPHLPLKILEVG